MSFSPHAPAGGKALPTSFDELMQFHDASFVEKAYVILLGRPADRSGLGTYTARLRRGAQRITLIDQLTRSSEGRSSRASLPGLERALRSYRIGRLPVIGAVFRRMFGIEGESPVERKLRIIINDMHRNDQGRDRRSREPAPQVPSGEALSLQQSLILAIAANS